MKDAVIQFHFQIFIAGDCIKEPCRCAEDVFYGLGVYIAFGQNHIFFRNKAVVQQVGLGVQ